MTLFLNKFYAKDTGGAMRTKGNCSTVTCIACMTSDWHDSVKFLSLGATEVVLRHDLVSTNVTFGITEG